MQKLNLPACRYRDDANQEVSPECAKLFHCNGSRDLHGDCMYGCEEGFAGEHCLERST